MLAALHTCLLSANESTPDLHVHLLHHGLTENDLALLQKTLGKTKLTPYAVTLKDFEGLRPMGQSVATYFRLIAPTLVNADRILYLDTDTLISVDLGELSSFDLAGKPAAMVPEAPAKHACDPVFLEHPGCRNYPHYFNAGVMLIDVPTWRHEGISEKCFEFLHSHEAPYYDQTALNIVLGATCPSLPEKFNRIANQRRHWPLEKSGNVLHFVDRPKPWDTLGRRFHPQAHLWWPVFQRTALAGKNPARVAATGGLVGYKKAAKDFVFTTALRSGIVSRVKGMP